MIIKIFKELGIEQKEAEVFLELLKLGAQPISVLAKYTNIPRTTMYSIIERLKKNNLIEEFERSKIRYVKCIPIENLTSVFDEQMHQKTLAISELNLKLPELSMIENKLSATPLIRLFEGKKSVTKMYDEMLQEKQGFYAIFNPKLVKTLMPEYHFVIPDTLRKNKLHAREIIVACEEANEYKSMYESILHQIKIFPKNIRINSDTIIFENKIYMISYDKNEMSGVEIKNEILANTQRVLFEQLWSFFL
ncbi:MAG: transcriptional regulator, TrmB [uncultured bacterium]|nr:MAG: transcriptional regulator, TrmB [uncultured bacterium]OGJ48079.1 MAG: hypothetical protein A2244_01155 [Candidatus Peregrinibacteria bacterium RIFOXYA2_FULL_41_18]OGJ48264.1 MAG: hypothetical protein A2344_03980 [Candidatus Peregrinibacteria bacterium RIFOXYB12_FULL_41_12]OGJ52249.1 MAG: hypothetical protein A2336_05270 [Candidatus Peregrinibacteria bacterium RIFOXYB2_FULL_41_88]OGJ52933.1 MAG: hypothetical protein A2448_00620 [Candidatus Peregrinibacteria bacterium RIFOXYC2_FULL_41_22]